MPAQETKNQVPFTVQGFITDPKSVGYQILTNYECIYWRALVSAEAWSLYEVLRSFCHREETTCYPSIKLLCDILGLKDRRRLTGRKSKSSGKEYKYPGLIDTLQEYDLVIAEVIGEEPMTSYIFHVNMTPGLLTSEQIEKLSETLRRKHNDLLQKHQATLVELKAMKRPSKIQPVEDYKQERGGNLPGGGVAICQEEGGNLPPKQQQSNTTQYNNIALLDVVDKLVSWGFRKDLANQALDQYGIDYVKDKIYFLEFEMKRTKIKSPFRWLYKAIQSNFSAPQGFKISTGNQHLKFFADVQEKNSAQELELENKQEERTKRREFLKNIYKTKEEDLKFWEMVKDKLREAFANDSGIIYNTYLSNAEMLYIKGDLIYLGFTSNLFVDRLNQSSVKKKIEAVLSSKAGQSMKVKFEVIKNSLYE